MLQTGLNGPDPKPVCAAMQEKRFAPETEQLFLLLYVCGCEVPSSKKINPPCGPGKACYRGVMDVHHSRPALSGFNLVETAIVLGIVGLVIGGIWVAANSVQSNVRKSEASKALIQIVQNVRAMFDGQSPSATGSINSAVISARAVPTDFVNGTNIVNPWNGGVTISLAQAGSQIDSLDIAYASMPRDVCIELTSRNTNVTTGTGLTQILIANGSSTVTVTSFPYSPATAATDCLATNTVTWRFGLRG